jgi:hypothetical protein
MRFTAPKTGTNSYKRAKAAPEHTKAVAGKRTKAKSAGTSSRKSASRTKKH